MKPLLISLPSLKVYQIELSGIHKLVKNSILINMSEEPIKVINDNSIIKTLESRIVTKCSIYSSGSRACLIEIEGDDFLNPPKKLWSETKKWTDVFELFPNVEFFKGFGMKKSPKDSIGQFELNFWYLPPKKLGRIHKDHPFSEIHVQIAGIGVMQKYREQDYNTVYQKIYLAPGIMHYPFFDTKGSYPWHSYDSITNCIWLAIEEHKS